MFGFGKKKIQKQEKFPAEIQVIPDEFYGAKDPVISYGSNKNKVELKKQPVFEGDSKSGNFLSRIIKNKKIFYTLIVIIFIGIVAVISWFYVNQVQKERIIILPEAEEPIVVDVKKEIIKEPVIVEEIKEELVEEILKEEIVIPSQVLEEKMLEFPSMFLVDSADVDNDDLTDAEEELFNTDSGTWDTDGDGYYDGQEVLNLYNPTGLAPMRLIDAGLVQEYVNPTWQYRVYFPIQWLMGQVDTRSSQVLFSSISGDFVEIAVFEKDLAVNFETWFGDKAEGQNFSDLQKFTNRFQEEGWKRKDNLVAYFVNNNKVYVMIYNSVSGGSVPYRHVMQMMVQSFRPSKTMIVIPEQEVFPPFPDFTNQDISTSTENLLDLEEFIDTEEIL